MLDLKFIRENPELVKAGIAKKNDNSDIDAILEMDEQRREIIREVEQLKGERNKASAEIGKKKKAGESADDAVAAMKEVGKKISSFDGQLREIEDSVDKTQKLATQIKGDTETIMLDVKVVVFMVESQMEKIENLEDYMMGSLGSDWNQIKNNWSMYKDGEITRGDFVKVALRKLGKNFLGIFVNVVS